MARRSTGKPAGLNQGTVVLPVEAIVPDPKQPRKTFPADELRNLAESLCEAGQISPIVVRPGPEGKYMIVVGERRWRAACEAGLSHIECVVRCDLDEQRAREMQFAENCQREDIPPLEQARSFKDYLDRYKLSQSELSRRTGIPQRTISNRLALLSLPASLQARIEAGTIGPYEALKIATLPVDQQGAVAEAVSGGRIGGRTLEKLIRRPQFRHTRGKMPHEVMQTTEPSEATASLWQKVGELEKKIFELAATYAFNEVARVRNAGSRRMPPCPECMKRGGRGYVRDIVRKMTSEERREWPEIAEGAKELSGEDEEIPEPTHVIEARCDQCGYEEFIGYA